MFVNSKKNNIKILFFIFLPISIIYGGVVALISSFYRKNILKQHKYNFPVINIGNLSVGGTGKTPHSQFFTKILTKIGNVCIISRGYRRKTNNVIKVLTSHTANQVGDEPLLLANKLPKTDIWVAKKRHEGILEATKTKEQPIIILDDGWQHWAVKASIHILLTTYQTPFFEDFVLPSGRLREFRGGYKRADVILITKCPNDLSQEEANNFFTKIRPLSHQKIFFSNYKYSLPYKLSIPNTTTTWEELEKRAILLLTGIADTQYLENFLDGKNLNITALKFGDHHHYTIEDCHSIIRKGIKTILTTEKDAMRLKSFGLLFEKQAIEIYCLPIRVNILFDHENELEQTLINLIHRKS